MLAASSLNLVASFLWSHPHCWVFKRLNVVLRTVECSNCWSTVKHPFKTEGERSQQTRFLVTFLVFVRLRDARSVGVQLERPFLLGISKVIPNSISITSIFHYSWLNIFSRDSLKKWYSSLFSPPPPLPASPVLERFKWLRQPSSWPLWRIIPVTRKWLVTQWWSLERPLRIGFVGPLARWHQWLLNGGDPNPWRTGMILQASYDICFPNMAGHDEVQLPALFGWWWKTKIHSMSSTVCLNLHFVNLFVVYWFLFLNCLRFFAPRMMPLISKLSNCSKVRTTWRIIPLSK